LDAAVTEFREAVRLNPGFENARHNLADVERHIAPPR
jgi:hypothetical protein